MNKSEQNIPMSPDQFAPFDGFPNCCAVARDSAMRLLWCNDEFCRVQGKTREELKGTTLEAITNQEMARECETILRPAFDEGRVVNFAQLTRGARWVTRAWPLDPKSFGANGVFIVMRQVSLRRDAPNAPKHDLTLARCADLGDLDVLTPREMEVFYYLASGMTVADIGELMHRSPKTVERHLESLHRKMGFKNRAELVRLAVERGLVQFSPEEWSQFVSRKRNAN